MSAIYRNGTYYGKEDGGGGGVPEGGTQGQILIKQSSTDGDADWNDIPEDKTKADLTDLAPAFLTSESYEVGQYITYDGDLYRCTTAHSGAWTAGDFTKVKVTDEIGLDSTDMADIITPLPGKPLDGVIFSPEERQVGWWYNMNGDGTRKPVYQKTIQTTMPSDVVTNNGSRKVPIGANVDIVTYYNAIIHYTSGSDDSFMAINSISVNDNFNSYSKIYITIPNNSIYLITQNSGWLNKPVHITVQYTKTTDFYE